MNRRLKLWSPRPEAGIIEDTGVFEQVDLGGEDILILARNTYILQEHVVPILRTEGIIYEYRGEPSIDPEILEAITTWERFRKGEEMGEEGERLCRKYRRNKSLNFDGGIPVWHEGLDRLPGTELSYILAARRNGESLVKRPRVRLSTIHSAKGAQAQHVVLFSDMAPRTAREYKKSPENEFRVWYVGLTRSKEKLTLVKQIGWNGYSF
jgi:superfamily I DNA/RNA helicase